MYCTSRKICCLQTSCHAERRKGRASAQPFRSRSIPTSIREPRASHIARLANLAPAPLLLSRGPRRTSPLLSDVRGPTPSVSLPGAGSRTPDRVLQRRHLHRRQRRLKSLIPHLEPGPINRLLQSLASQNAEGMRHSSLLRRLPNPARHLVHDHAIMRRIPAQQTSDANNGVILPSQSQTPRRQRDLKRPRHPRNIDVFLRSASPNQPVASTQQQPLRNKRIKPRHHNGKPPPRSVKLSFQSRKVRLRHRLHLESDFLCDLRVLCGELVSS